MTGSRFYSESYFDSNKFLIYFSICQSFNLLVEYNNEINNKNEKIMDIFLLYWEDRDNIVYNQACIGFLMQIIAFETIKPLINGSCSTCKIEL